MIKNIIFDFGDVFINLDKSILLRALGGSFTLEQQEHILRLNRDLEIGKIHGTAFIKGLNEILPSYSEERITNLWNSMLLDFPPHRLRFIEELSNSEKYRLFLLSNTNEIHIEHVSAKMGATDYNRFRNSFEKFYLSHEIGLRKPEPEVFSHLLKNDSLLPQETLFIDDTLENTRAAEALDIKVWHLQVGQEDVTDLIKRL